MDEEEEEERGEHNLADEISCLSEECRNQLEGQDMQTLSTFD